MFNVIIFGSSRGDGSLKTRKRLVEEAVKLAEIAGRTLIFTGSAICDSLAYFVVGLGLVLIFFLHNLHSWFPYFSLYTIWFGAAALIGMAVWAIQPGSGRTIVPLAGRVRHLLIPKK